MMTCMRNFSYLSTSLYNCECLNHKMLIDYTSQIFHNEISINVGKTLNVLICDQYIVYLLHNSYLIEKVGNKTVLLR